MINNMVDIRIKSLKNTSFDELFEAFRQAFAEYEMQLNRAELQAMWNRNIERLPGNRVGNTGV